MEKLFSKVNYSYISEPLNDKLKETNKKNWKHLIAYQ